MCVCVNPILLLAQCTGCTDLSRGTLSRLGGARRELESEISDRLKRNNGPERKRPPLCINLSGNNSLRGFMIWNFFRGTLK